MKLWDKGNSISQQTQDFTVGRDQEMDLYLAPFDILGSLAHIQMLQTIGLLKMEELVLLKAELTSIFKEMKSGNFRIGDEIEDIHSQVEILLINRLGDIGKKIHTGRSRNDQVLLDIKLYLRSSLQGIISQIDKLFSILTALSEKHKADLLPGYTHYQLAMPSSFGLWFGAYAECLSEDLDILFAAFKAVNKNPLGSGAGYGSSFPLNRSLTTELLGFEDLNYNVVHAQLSRGKTERVFSQAIASVAHTLSKMSYDICLFMNQNFGFVGLPTDLTTGSSIMPHKKNPDIFELVRAKCNRLQAIPNEINLLINNLPVGYHRDFQLLKEIVFPSVSEIQDCLNILIEVLPRLEVKKDILKNPGYKMLYTVEAVNEAVISGIPFRDAYKKIGAEVENGTFEYDKDLNHSHEGSMGNLCNDKIEAAFRKKIAQFQFEKINLCLDKLLEYN